MAHGFEVRVLVLEVIFRAGKGNSVVGNVPRVSNSPVRVFGRIQVECSEGFAFCNR